MKTVELLLPGTPIAKARPRFTRTGRTYTDLRTRTAEGRVLAAWIANGSHFSPAAHRGPVSVELIATFTAAPSWTKRKRQSAIDGELPHTIRPDVDNLLKIIDGLNGAAWADDAQIITATVSKQYGETASTLIRITYHED